MKKLEGFGWFKSGWVEPDFDATVVKMIIFLRHRVKKKNLHLVEKKGENKMRIKMQSASHEIEWTAGSWSWS